MNKFFFIAATAAAVLVSCAKTEVVQKATNEATPIAFSIYAGQTATKATYGDITTDNLKSSADGFGVFAYYTKTDAWSSAAATATPNFMYNQQVKYNGSANTTLYTQKWEYSPLKYWPNGENATSYAANSTSADKITFFAYAPYTAVTPSTGATVTATAYPADGKGVVSVSANSATDAPTVTFVVPDNSHEQIDLLYATPYVDVTKQSLGSTINLRFHHALAKINPQVQAVVDAVSPTTANLVAAQTKIILVDLTITANGTKKGTLNLEDGTWTIASTPENSEIKFSSPDSFTTTTFGTKTGFNVTETATDLNATNTPMIIPDTIAADGLKVEAHYWVVTKDDNLDGGYSEIENNIYTTNTSEIVLQQGKKYNIVVRLGLNSIDFNVLEVEGWGDGGSLAPVDLPLNS